jgi:hypothetical protein
MRASGLGWALGIGRLGGIAGPALGGYLLALGLRPPTIPTSERLLSSAAMIIDQYRSIGGDWLGQCHPAERFT